MERRPEIDNQLELNCGTEAAAVQIATLSGAALARLTERCLEPYIRSVRPVPGIRTVPGIAHCWHVTEANCAGSDSDCARRVTVPRAVSVTGTSCESPKRTAASAFASSAGPLTERR